MITAASLKEYTRKDLAEMAKKRGVTGWHSMRKDQLVRALVRSAKKAAAKKTPTAPTAKRSTRATTKSVAKRSSPTATKSPAKSRRKTAAGSRPIQKSATTMRRIQMANAERERLKDLSIGCGNNKTNGHSRKKNGSNGAKPIKDRIVLMVRDPYWLHVCWEVDRQSVERVQASMKELWHTAVPMLRLLEVDAGTTTSTVEQVAKEIEIHGGLNNWYIDVHNPPKSYRVDIGYKASNGKFHTLARSNSVTTPKPGSSDVLDQNWQDVAKNYEKVYAMSGGYNEQKSVGDLQDLFEERLRRPMGSPLVTRFGVGAEKAAVGRSTDFLFELEAEMIIYGQTKADAYVTLSGKPVKLRPDGSFTVRQAMPDRRQVLPVVAGSSDGVEQRTIVLAVERNTKVMEPVFIDPNE